MSASLIFQQFVAFANSIANNTMYSADVASQLVNRGVILSPDRGMLDKLMRELQQEFTIPEGFEESYRRIRRFVGEIITMYYDPGLTYADLRAKALELKEECRVLQIVFYFSYMPSMTQDQPSAYVH